MVETEYRALCLALHPDAFYRYDFNQEERTVRWGPTEWGRRRYIVHGASEREAWEGAYQLMTHHLWNEALGG